MTGAMPPRGAWSCRCAWGWRGGGQDSSACLGRPGPEHQPASRPWAPPASPDPPASTLRLLDSGLACGNVMGCQGPLACFAC